jgi:hypothetical protein
MQFIQDLIMLHFSGKSRLRSPIPADPGYGDNVRGSRYRFLIKF